MTEKVILLSEERVYRNESEYRIESVAIYKDLKLPSLQALAIAMIRSGIAQADEEFAVFRGTTPIFQNKKTGSYYMPLSWYADGRAFGIRKKNKDTAIAELTGGKDE